MSSIELQRLMHAVLDGEATPEEADMLQRALATDPAARREFQQLGRLFDELAAMPRQHPPEGLVATVTAALPAVPPKGDAADQLSDAARVLGTSSEGIHVRTGASVKREQPSLPPHRRSTMTPHPPYSAKRKALIGGGIAVFAAMIVWQFGFESMPKSEDVAGTVVPAQRYRASQGAADIRLGDQSIAQLMQNDAFVKLVRDPEVQALVREPGFAEAAKILQNNPEVARIMVERAGSVQRALASPEMLQAMERNAEAAAALESAAEAAAVLRASPAAQKMLAENSALARYVGYLADMQKTAVFKQMEKVDAAQALALNAEQAQRFAVQSVSMEKALNVNALEKYSAQSTELQKFMTAREQAARLAKQYQEAAKVLQANAAAAQFVMMDAAAAHLLMFNPQVAKVAALSPDAMRTLTAYPQATKALLASPAASLYLLQNPAAANVALQSVAAERSAERAVKMDRAAERALKADRAVK